MCTMAAILYVSQQVEATKIGYQINQQQLILNDTLDQRQMLLYNVYNLKSPENLQQSFYKNSERPAEYQILGNKQIIILSNRKEKGRPRSFFGITSLAEAKTQE